MTPRTIAHQAPLSMEFSRQEYWSGLPCPPPGELLDPGIELTSLTSSALAGGFFTTGARREAPMCVCVYIYIYIYIYIYMYMYKIDSLCCTLEINTSL